jgi:alpha-tubulin suppressor-like RCC1 family protein
MNIKNIAAKLFSRPLRFALALVVFSAAAATSGATDLILGATQRSSSVLLANLDREPTISMGGGHTLAVDQLGRLWAWGENDKGQIGDGSTENRNAPVQIVRDGGYWVAVAAGLNFSLAIDNEGKLWAWGSNVVGQLGDGTVSDSLIPRQVGAETYWRAVSAGDYHVLALRSNGALYSWGSNQAGQLGRSLAGEGINGQTPSMSMRPALVVGSYKAVSAGGSHSLAIAANDIGWSWGANHKGQLGRNTGAAQIDETPNTFSGVAVDGAAAGGDFSLVVVGGLVTAYGDNQFGQLGQGTTNPSGFYNNANSVASVVNLSANASAVAAGRQHALAILDTGVVQAWGRNDSGQAPNPFVLGGAIPIGVSAGGKASLVILAGGSVATVGRNIEGQHGDGRVQVQTAPVDKALALRYKQILVGDRHTLAIDSSDKLWSWGDNSAGQLGDGTIADSSAPVSILPDSAGIWTKIAVGANNSAAIKLNGGIGELYIWGSNYYGQFGNGSTTAGLSPVRVPGDWIEVALGEGHVLAIKSDGTLFAWGNNMNAQLGYPKPGSTQTTQLTPKRVGLDAGWVKIAAGQNHSLGLRGGTLYGWGQNVLGQLGNGSNTDASTPAKIGSMSWSSIYVGGSTSAGILTGGTLYVWGNNDKGQLGDGGTQPSNKPKEFPKDLRFTSAALSSTSIAARTTGGEIWVAGSNDSSRIGFESLAAAKTPLRLEMVPPTNVASVSLGGAAGAALDSDGNLYVWGSNKYGQLNESTSELARSTAVVAVAPNASISARGDTPNISGGRNFFDYAEGESIQFVATSTATGPFTYQWYRDDVEINGAQGRVYEVTGTSSIAGGAYSVVISSAYGEPAASTAIVARLWEAPVITEAPSDQGVLVGGTASLSVQATGTDLTYSWTPSGGVSTPPNYTTPAAPLGGVLYTVTVANTRNGINQTDSASATVTGYNPVTLSAADAATRRVGADAAIQLDRAVGDTLTLTVSASVSAQAYQWRKDLVEIPNATGITYALDSLTALSGGSYDVVVSNGASSVTSKAAVVRIYSAPVFTRQPVSQSVVSGKTATLTAVAAGYNTPVLQWYGPSGIIPGATKTTLVVSNFNSDQAGAYYVRATNTLGFADSEVATLSLPGSVTGKPTINAGTPLLSQSVVAGGTATFAVTATAATQYQWRKNGVSIPGANSATLAVRDVGTTDYASYSVVVSNSVGSVTSAPALLSSRSDVVGDARRTLFNAAVGLNGGLYAGRFKASATPPVLPDEAEEAYVRLNVTRAGTVSGVYTDGLLQYRFGGRFTQDADSNWVTSISLGVSEDKLLITVRNDVSAPVVTVQLLPGGVADGAALKLARQGMKDASLAQICTGVFQTKDSGLPVGVLSTRVNPSSGIVIVTGTLPDGGRVSGSSVLYADPAGIQAAPMSDLILRLAATKRVFSTLAFSPESFVGDASIVTVGNTEAYDLTGAVYAVAPLGGLLPPFVSVREEAILNWVHTVGLATVSTELGRFTASGNRLLPGASAFASAGGRFSLTFSPSTGQVSGYASFGAGLPERTPKRFTGVVLQGGYRGNGGLLGIGITDDGTVIRFEPAN